MDKTYEAPALTVVGSVHGITLQELDKIGTSDDFLTQLVANLTGTIQPDP